MKKTKNIFFGAGLFYLTFYLPIALMAYYGSLFATKIDFFYIVISFGDRPIHSLFIPGIRGCWKRLSLFLFLIFHSFRLLDIDFKACYNKSYKIKRQGVIQ
jgi:hypothetical protein